MIRIGNASSRAPCSAENLALWADVCALGRELAPLGCEPQVLSERSDRLIVRFGSVVFKVHARGTDAVSLDARLRQLLQPAMAEIFLAPLHSDAIPIGDDRLLSIWPYALPIQGLEQAPWAAAARLLARLHQLPVPGSWFPSSQPRRRLQAALGQLQGLDARDANVHAVRRAAATLQLDERSPPALIHGDWHFGQLLLTPAGWRLIDADDLGRGDPLWDLARPAAFFAAGLIAPSDWQDFLHAYREEGGPAVNEEPWQTLAEPAKALTVQCAAAALLRARRHRAPLLEAEYPLIDACRRIIKTYGNMKERA